MNDINTYNDQNLIYINCFYYGFYIKKEDLKKYHIHENDLNNNIKSQESQQEFNKKTKKLYYKNLFN